MPCSKLWLDLETYSETPIKHGTYRYAEDADIMLWLYAFDDGEPKCWDLTDPNDGPENHAEMLMELEYGNSELYAANSMFDRSVLRYNGYPTPINRWRDTMVQALCHALPGALGTLGSVLGIAEDLAKKKDGNALIHLFCKPRPENMKLRRATRETHPEAWQRFIEYGLNDITAMREVEKKLPRYNYPDKAYSELENWHLDQVINDRGFCVDLELVHAAVNAVKLEKEVLRKQTVEMTNGEVTSTTRRDQVLEHLLVNYGVVLEDLKKGTLDKYLNDPSMPQGVRELLAVRLQATTSSTAKYNALREAVNNDGRCRGTIQFVGASRTGRACLAEGTLVTVKTATGTVQDKPIQEVRLSDRVWDGVAWVQHEGVVFSGVKDVIAHDGVSATPEHIVWLDDTTSVTLQDAKEKGSPLWIGNSITYIE